MASNTNLAQGTVGLFIEEFDLICSRAGLFVRKAPGHLQEEVACWGFQDCVNSNATLSSNRLWSVFVYCWRLGYGQGEESMARTRLNKKNEHKWRKGRKPSGIGIGLLKRVNSAHYPKRNFLCCSCPKSNRDSWMENEKKGIVGSLKQNEHNDK